MYEFPVNSTIRTYIMTALSNSRRLFTKGHQFITQPIGGVSYFGLSNYAKRYLMNFSNADLDKNPNLKYSIHNNERIEDFLQQTQIQDTVANRLFRSRFLIKKNQHLAVLKTLEYDIELNAPVDLRVLFVNPECWKDWRTVIYEQWLFKVQVFNEEQLSELLLEEPHSFVDYV